MFFKQKLAQLHLVSLLTLVSLLILGFFDTTVSPVPLYAEPNSKSPKSSSSKPSRLLKQSGEAKLGKMMPFFSGWTITNAAGAAYSRTKALKEKRPRYVVNICASWCKPCLKGLEQIAKAKQKFSDSNTGLILLVADSSANARKIYEHFGFDWATVIVDEFQTFAFKLAPDKKKSGTPDSLSLPRTIIFNTEGKVSKIISREGKDYIDQIFAP